MITQTKTTNQNLPPASAQPTPRAANVANAGPETKQTPVIEMHEAPYSWNVSAQDPNGFIEMFTVRAVSENGFRERVARVKAQLIAENYKPAPVRGANASSAAQARAASDAKASAETTADADAAPLCGIHGTPMQHRTGKGGQKFWSCPQHFANGEYCNYRPPKQ